MEADSRQGDLAALNIDYFVSDLEALNKLPAMIAMNAKIVAKPKRNIVKRICLILR